MTNTVNPFTEIADEQTLEFAHTLIIREQNPEYWQSHPMPLDPDDSLSVRLWEFVRRLNAPLCTAAALYASFQLANFWGVLLSASVFFVAYHLFDGFLRNESRKAQGRINARDRSRHFLVSKISERLNLRPDLITLPLIEQMHLDYLADADAIDRRLNPRKYKTLALEAARERVMEERRANGYVVYDDYDYEYEPSYSYPSVNSNGAPMLPGGAVDVYGNSFGSDDGW